MFSGGCQLRQEEGEEEGKEEAIAEEATEEEEVGEEREGEGTHEEEEEEEEASSSRRRHLPPCPMPTECHRSPSVSNNVRHVMRQTREEASGEEEATSSLF